MAGARTVKGEARRAEVLRLAQRLLATGGLDRFALREVAAAAGMAVGNLQYYFPSRDDLLEAVVRAELARNLDAVRAHTAGAADLDRLADDLLGQWASEGGAVFNALFALARHDGRFGALHQEVYATFTAELAAGLRRLDPGATEAEAAVRARVVTALLDGMSLQALGAGPNPGPTDAATLVAVKGLVAAVVAGRGVS